ncbi:MULTISPECIES: hypothetical protein [unclassified Bradyrhizobium]|uniref:hypothetical protein n=1 Tax=unclassified Bradyrhizobium TaxID=2631580 RepID=UPI002113E80A
MMEDLKRDMAILATSGSDWTDRTKRLGARVSGLDIFSQVLVERVSGGWRITDKGRAVLGLMEQPSVDPLPAEDDLSPELTAVERAIPQVRERRGHQLARRRRLREARRPPRARAS